jgi:hypothetical protein
VVPASSASCSSVAMAYLLIGLSAEGALRESSELPTLQLNRRKQAPARMPAGRRTLRAYDGAFRMSLGEGVQESLRMSRLTQRKVGRSDNNEAGKTPYFNASMA